MINLYHFPLVYRSDYFREVNQCYQAGQGPDLLNLILRQVTKFVLLLVIRKLSQVSLNVPFC